MPVKRYMRERSQAHQNQVYKKRISQGDQGTFQLCRYKFLAILLELVPDQNSHMGNWSLRDSLSALSFFFPSFD